MAPRGTASDRVLAVLRKNPGRTIAARDLMAAADVATLTALRTHVGLARRGLGAQASRLHSIRGAGYRWDNTAPAPVRKDELALDLEVHTAAVAGRSVQLTARQVAILRALTAAAGQLLDAEQLRQRAGVSSVAAVKVQVSELRKALQTLHEVQIVTVRGQGYRYIGPPAYCPVPRQRPTGRLYVDSTGQVLRDGRPLRLRRREHALLELLLDRTGQPVSYTELLAYAHIPNVATLQTAMCCIRTALRDSAIHIVHNGQGSNAYALHVGTH